MGLAVWRLAKPRRLRVTRAMVVSSAGPIISGNTADPGHFVSHLYELNPLRPQKLLRPGELLYFVKETG